MSPATRPNDLPPGATADDVDDVMTPAMTDEEAERVRPIREAPVSLQAVLPKNRGGRPAMENPKVHVSLRLDPDVLAAYKGTGAGWQGRVNETLREGVDRLRGAASKPEQPDGRSPTGRARRPTPRPVRPNGSKATGATDSKKGS